MITQYATFREFTDADGDGFYERNAPTDEYRRLRKVASGWELTDLMGGVQSFDAQGRWARTQDAHGNAKVAFYSGSRLVRVDMPDGRSETFSYHPDGKLASLTEVGVDGSTSRTWSYTWSGHDLARIDAPDLRAWVFRYDDPRLPGYMTRMTLMGTDSSERVEGAWEYDAQGNLTRSWKGDSSPTGPSAVEVTSYSYDNPYLPRETRVTDPLGKVAAYIVGRDPESQIPRIESVSGDCPTCGAGPNSQTFYEDPTHPLLKTREVDAKGTVTLYTYDANGRVTSRTEAFGAPLQRTTTWEYSGPFPSLVTAVETPSTSGSGSRRTRFTYDAEGNRLSETIEGIEAGSTFHYTTTYSYNTAGALEETDPPGFGTADVTRITYDPVRGNLVPLSRTDPLIGETSFTYDEWNRMTAITDPNGVRTLTHYDPLNRISRVAQEGATPAESLTTLYEYTPLGDLARIILPEGNLVTYGYDVAGRLASIERKPDRETSGERVVYTLNGAGRRTREEQQRWADSAWATDTFTDYVYSSPCHLDKILHADGSATEYAYDCNGNVERVWDINHPSNNRSNPATATLVYDALNRVEAISRSWAGGGNAVTRYEYSVQDHLTKTTDAEGNITRYTYSDRGLMTQQVSEVSGTAEYLYNDHGEPISETDARGTTVISTVDVLDRRIFVDYPEDSLDTRFTYDDPSVPFSKGRLTAITRNGGTIPYRYDRFGRLVQDGVLSYSYDRNGNRREVLYPGGVKGIYTFDFSDREEQLVLSEPGRGATTIVADTRYLAGGPLASLILGNGLAETRSYNLRFFPTGIKVPGKLDWRYTTDNVGNVLSINDALSPASTRSFSYQDVTYFLTRADGPWGNRAWTYDKIGNRLTETRDGATTLYSYRRNAAGGNTSRLITVAPPAPADAISYYYDAAGNQTYRTQGAEKLRFTYNSERRLSQISADEAGETGVQTSLTYEGRGFLDTSSFAPSPGADPQARTQATFNTAGTLHHKLSGFTPAAPAPREQPAEEKDSYVIYFADRPVAILEKTAVIGTGGRTEDRRLLYLTTDHLGTPILATQEDGNVLWAGGFSPFGEDFAQASGAGLFLRLPGQWQDTTWQSGSLQTGLSYNLHRWYESGSGRYSQSDPLGLTGGENLYAYAFNRPLTFSDPLGLQALPAPGPQWIPKSLPPAPPPLRPVPPLPPVCTPKVPLPWGRVLGVGGAVLTVVWEMLFNPPPLGTPQEWPVEHCGKNCGTCDPSEHGFLQYGVDQACKKGARSCVGIQDPAILTERFWKNVQCAFARDEINLRCYGGGDPTHRDEAQKARDAAVRCLDSLTRP